MSLNHAKKLARLGFHVFPLLPRSKLPAIPEFPKIATASLERLPALFTDPVMGIDQSYNVGISTSRFSVLPPYSALVVIDVDTKNERGGLETLAKLEIEHGPLPKTFRQKTPSGGLHIFFQAPRAFSQGGTNVLGPGLDIRSKGGFVVGAGSEIEIGGGFASYAILDPAPVAPIPDWLLSFFEERERAANVRAIVYDKNDRDMPASQTQAMRRAREYLEHAAEPAIEGQGGDAQTFKVAAYLKDLGLSPENALSALFEWYNPRCEPPWEESDLARKVRSAYAYGRSDLGVASPENDFEVIEVLPPEESAIVLPDTLGPVEQINQEFAYCVLGGDDRILWRTTDALGRKKIEMLNFITFRRKLANKTIQVDSRRRQPISDFWLEHPKRASFDGVVFEPGREISPRFFNLWQGFSVSPAHPDEQPNEKEKAALNAFLEHALLNVCGGSRELFDWLLNYFAHLIQRPWEKPLTALVFKGARGVGKNSLIETVGALVKDHTLITARRRYLVGNFNSHLENLLILGLDEAFWSGDKEVEGIVKDLITGTYHEIEHKGLETYRARNLVRVVIIGNESWLVPAANDERRYAVFNVGDGRKQDTKFFQAMREGMEGGGHRFLLRYLLDFPLKPELVNVAPVTNALLEQKLNTLDPVARWWFAALTDQEIPGLILGSDEFSSADAESSDANLWPLENQFVLGRTLCEALKRYCDGEGIRVWAPSPREVIRRLRNFGALSARKQKSKKRLAAVALLPCAEARVNFAAHLNHEIDWDNSSDENELASIV